ncbi:adenylate kinase 2, putative [Plasmodium malariae]|uniref:Adenylate kinase 2, putative n=2 Tax=Plasmodium (Plasmodium) TaxID=418103 RepID=A0A1A8VTC0_PLAMA|nr:adenylate kinase 2, putative [Plasmodium malariae]SBS82926.1 adenylate kinase 2, putative (AK2) [Plasmodium malariae]SBT74982.1 adenylate kinase 2, putative [Plasmodium malariae]SBT87455.1 adenylate kinase 2, putative [Plasmodium malariae]
MLSKGTKKIYILNGAPGSGKDTQCRLLSKKYNFKIITISELLKEHLKDSKERIRDSSSSDQCVKELTEQEKRDLEYIQKSFTDGSFVPDDIVIGIFLKQLEKYTLGEEECEGIIINGFPRTYEQALLFKKNNIEITNFINMSVSKECLLERVNNRIRDPITNVNYNIKIIELIKKKRKNIKLHTEEELLLTSQNEDYKNINDEILMRLKRRADDNESTFNKRYDLYLQNEKKIISLFFHVCKNIDGEKSIEGIFEQICAIIDQTILHKRGNEGTKK